MNDMSSSSGNEDKNRVTATCKKQVNSERGNFIMLLLKATHLIIDLALFFLAFILFRYGKLTDIDTVGFRYNFFVTFGYAFLICYFVKTYNASAYGFYRVRVLAFSQALSQFFAVAITYIAVCVAWRKVAAPWPLLLLLPVQFSIDAVWSYISTACFFKLYPRRRTLLIYRNSLDYKRFGAITGKPLERMHEITDELQFDGSFLELEPKLKGYDSIFVAGVNPRCMNGLLKYCCNNGVAGFFLPHIGDVIMMGSTHIPSFDSPVLYVNRKVLSPIYAFIKRTFDIVSSSLTLILLSPVMLITAIIIKCYDKGPVLYKQTRLTKDGKEFKILKFRSMRVDAEQDGVARLSSGENDDRITPIGRFIRKCRIDELPQLINIFKGDMSVVGPRPERPEIAEQYYESMPDFKLRLQVRAGLTGYAQVYGKYNTDPYEKLEYDLLYINQMNYITDIELCFATFLTLFQKESTEGVAVGATTAMEYENGAEVQNTSSKSENSGATN